MRSGELRHRVVLQQLVAGEDDYGQPTDTWQNMATVWAKIEDLAGREYFRAQQVPTAQISTRITIRYRSDVKPEMRIVWGDRTFNIAAVLDPDGRNRELQIMCLEVV
mgnify:CR=1 FL=1